MPIQGDGSSIPALLQMGAREKIGYLERGNQGGKTKDLCSQCHSTFIIKHALCIHKQYSHLLSIGGFAGSDDGFGPHPDTFSAMTILMIALYKYDGYNIYQLFAYLCLRASQNSSRI
jgi:hypothetical protein